MREVDDQKLLSIIVPVYNGGRYIDGLFGQFENQNLHNVELVFVDDGSTDDTYEKLMTWHDRNRYVMNILQQENKGVSAARNVGVHAAKGKYLAFLDVDDAIAPNYFALLTEYAIKNIDVLVFNSARVTVDSLEKTSHASNSGAAQNVDNRDMLTEFISDPTRFGVYNMLLRREYLSECGIVFPVGYKYYEDYDYLIQIFAQTKKIVRVHNVLYYYVLREGSAMGRFNADRINCLELMKRRESWLEEVVPGFAPMYCRWGVARIYWSVLWQAALAFPTYGEFAGFAELTSAKKYLAKLKGYPDTLLQLSTKVFLINKFAYYVAVRMVGRTKSKIQPVKLRDIQPLFAEDIAFY